MSYQALAGDVLHFCNRHNLDKFELIGHSVGGKVAQYVCFTMLCCCTKGERECVCVCVCTNLVILLCPCQFLCFCSWSFPGLFLASNTYTAQPHRALALLEPDRVQGLVVIDIAPVSYSPDEPHWKAVSDIIAALCTVRLQPGMSKRDVDLQLKTAVPDPALRAFCLTNVDSKSGTWKVHLECIAQQLDVLAGFEIGGSPGPSESTRDHHPQYHGDAFFIHGGQSRFVRHSHLVTIGTYFPNHMLTTIRGAGHWVHAEAPEDTTALLKRFLDR
jgi:pimeloyl-ACP methyl ester carboxylesterase